uniref:rhomboid protease n=1 Tax=Setaria digitata TaxID=48799 RepID=A0A915PEB3_9BILA
MLCNLMRWTCELTRKSPRLLLLQPVRSRFGLNRKEKYRRRIDELKEKIEQSKQKLPYQEDIIPLRSPRDLWKAFGFTVGDRFAKYRQLRDGVKCTFVLVGINMIVMLMWGIKSWQLFMWRWFTNSFASKALCLPMVLSAFSHANMLHLVLNMYVLNTFAPLSIDQFLGIEQFWAFYITAAAVSSLAGITHKCLIRTNRRALGASGAIMALLVYTCMKMPDARLKIVFIPHFDFSAKSAVSGMIAFDFICLLLGFKMFDHAAHLGGSLFGLFYGIYGQHFIWKKYGDKVLKLCGLNAEKREEIGRPRRNRSSSPRPS